MTVSIDSGNGLLQYKNGSDCRLGLVMNEAQIRAAPASGATAISGSDSALWNQALLS